MPFNFVKFTDTETSFAASVTIRATGQMGFSAGAQNLYSIRDYDYCVFYFDPEKRAVGIELTKENSDGAIPIKKSDSNTHVRAKNFCDKFGIDYSKSHRHRLKKDAQSGLLFFELGQEEEDTEEDGGEIAPTEKDN
jgi:hypothetical protein